MLERKGTLESRRYNSEGVEHQLKTPTRSEERELQNAQGLPSNAMLTVRMLCRTLRKNLQQSGRALSRAKFTRSERRGTNLKRRGKPVSDRLYATHEAVAD